MKIYSYNFGKIVINGKEYTNDVIIFPDYVRSSWWRKEGHKLHLEDLKEVFEYNPDFLIIGTGNSGLMKVPQKLSSQIKNKGINLIIEKTPRAVKKFNKKQSNTIAALHLTC